MPRNALGRDIPTTIPGVSTVIPFAGAFKSPARCPGFSPRLRSTYPGQTKLLSSLDEIFEAVGLRDGMSISFHHHLRNGDKVVNYVLDAIAKKGIRDLTLVPTALFGVHREIIKHIESGVITCIYGSINGPIGRRVSRGVFKSPVILRSHGGRARAMEAGDLKVDVAFLAAPAADCYGNISGTGGPSSCGALGYAMTDAWHAEHVVALTDNLVEYPVAPASIDQSHVDYVIEIDNIGDPKGIVSGTTMVTTDPARLRMGELAAELIERAGLIKDGFTFQTGAGGASLAGAAFVRDKMRSQKVTGSFASGGITSYFVDMHEEGLFRRLLDVQSFDLEAVRSIAENPFHVEMSASMYGNPHNSGCVVNRLDAVILGATEVDINFNVNVNTEADGDLLHGIGGHMDTAAGAGLTIVVAPLIRGRIPLIVDDVITVTSPGETIDAIVTERGVAINPRRDDLIEATKGSSIPRLSIEALRDTCHKVCGKRDPLEFTDRIIGVVEYRDGTIIDVVREVSH